MANPAIVNITQGEWVIAATAVTSGIINKSAWGLDYYQTYRTTGEAAPSSIIGTAIPEEAIPMFQENSQELIVSSEGIDVYICCFNRTNTLTAPGKVRVDV